MINFVIFLLIKKDVNKFNQIKRNVRYTLIIEELQNINIRNF